MAGLNAFVSLQSIDSLNNAHRQRKSWFRSHFGIKI